MNKVQTRSLMSFKSLALNWASSLAVVAVGLLQACASAAPQGTQATQSGTSAVGTPTMVQTNLGPLATWDVGPRNAALTVVLWPSIFTDHMIYAGVVKELAAKYRVILVDGYGHGKSGGPTQKTFTMLECATALKQLLDSKGIDRAVLGGTSWGGLVATEFALAHPERTQGLVLLNTPFLMPADGAGMGEKFITWGSKQLLWTDLFTGGVARSFFMPATREREVAYMTHFHQSLQASNADALSTAIRSVLIERKSLEDRLGQVRASSLVIAGDKDEMYPLDTQRAAVARMKAGRLEVVASQHISVVDNPTQVMALVVPFLEQIARATVTAKP